MRVIRYFLTGAAMAAGVMLAGVASAQSTSDLNDASENMNQAGEEMNQAGDDAKAYGSDKIEEGKDAARDKAGDVSDKADEFGSNLNREEVSGTVSKVSEGQLQIQTDEGEKLTLKTDEETTFTGKEGEVQTLQDIEEGEQVRAAFNPDSADNHALQIEVVEEGDSVDMPSPDSRSGTGTSDEFDPSDSQAPIEE